MALDSQQVAETLVFDRDRLNALREQWLRLMELAVWGDVGSSKMGALGRMRKRLLEVGENLNTFVGDRGWIPRPREQLKSALGASVKLRDSLLSLERAAATTGGGADFAEFERLLLDFRRDLMALVEAHENRWATLLDSQYADEDDD